MTLRPTQKELEGRPSTPPFLLTEEQNKDWHLEKGLLNPKGTALYMKQTTRLLKEAYFFRRGKRTVRNLRALMGLEGDSCTYQGRV